MEHSTKMTLLVEGGKNNVKALQQPLQILAWSWGLSAGRRGMDDSEIESHHQNISMTKYVGCESPHIASMIKGLTAFNTVVFQCENESSILVMTMKNVFFTSLSTGGSGGEDRFTENITMAFDAVTYQFTEKENGKAANSESSNLDFEQRGRPKPTLV